ncbi:hypothetical protein A4F85_04825 [Delftia sp. GW456-R20]|uniref:hypothetical protein n=1 Tax=Delftia sp. GW456-R20 TaxID=1827145 RepID=UPI0007AEB49E|nr:hypothetical protein [Delftia sp. GW456-R20]KZK32039.1 hypothetical protein A4F85_04825 [Delftia sp. GW456-R20]
MDQEINQSSAVTDIDEVTQQLSAALAVLRRGSGLSLARARVITATASALIDTIKIEAQPSAIDREK